MTTALCVSVRRGINQRSVTLETRKSPSSTAPRGAALSRHRTASVPENFSEVAVDNDPGSRLPYPHRAPTAITNRNSSGYIRHGANDVTLCCAASWPARSPEQIQNRWALLPVQRGCRGIYAFSPSQLANEHKNPRQLDSRPASHQANSLALPGVNPCCRFTRLLRGSPSKFLGQNTLNLFSIRRQDDLQLTLPPNVLNLSISACLHCYWPLYPSPRVCLPIPTSGVLYPKPKPDYLLDSAKCPVWTTPMSVDATRRPTVPGIQYPP